MDTSSLPEAVANVGGYVLALATAVVTVVRGRRDAAQIAAATAAIEQKTGPEVDSIYLGNAGAALEMQLKVNESQAAEIHRLTGVIQQKDEQIVLLETSLRAMSDRLDAAEFSLQSARREAENLERQLAPYREGANPPAPKEGPPA